MTTTPTPAPTDTSREAIVNLAKWLRAASAYYVPGGVSIMQLNDAANALLALLDRAEAAERDRDNWKAHAISRGKRLRRTRDEFINIRDELCDEGDRVYFGSTNHADAFKDAVEWLDDFTWGKVMGEPEDWDLLGALEKAQAALAAERDALRAALEEAKRLREAAQVAREAVKTQNGVIIAGTERLIAAERKLACGHHHSLGVRNIESGVVFCELCEARSELRDALKMEEHNRARAEAAEAKLANAREALEKAKLRMFGWHGSADIIELIDAALSSPSPASAPDITETFDIDAQLTAARTEGRREGLREAAKVVDGLYLDTRNSILCCDTLDAAAAAIRALLPPDIGGRHGDSD